MMFFRVKDGEYEFTEKRSRFIAVARCVSCRDDVKALVAQLRAEHREARHVCYGYIADESGADFGYDDDGEPQGTAGKPIYTAIEGAGARRTAIAVVRYFGGIKLGAGGLTRAYREAAIGVIRESGLIRSERKHVYRVECSGDVFKKTSLLLRNMLCEIEQILYNDTVEFTVIAPDGADVTGALVPLGASVIPIGEKTVDIKGDTDGL